MERVKNFYSNVGVIIAAAGAGSRFRYGNKLFKCLDGLPVFCHCLKTFLECLSPEHIRLVVSEENRCVFRDILRKYNLPQISCVAGGETRGQSVLNGLKDLPNSVEYAAVHDAARPYTSGELVEKCIASALKYGSGVAAKPVTDTIKITDTNGNVVSTPDRTRLRAAETPQIFIKEVLINAYEKLQKTPLPVTDDASAVELAGGRVHLVLHNGFNGKITFSHDLS